VRSKKLIKALVTEGYSGGSFFEINWSHDGKVLAAGNNNKVVLVDIRYFQ
jgi:hypothetical protein